MGKESYIPQIVCPRPMPPDRLIKFNNQRFFLTYANVQPRVNCESYTIEDFLEKLRLHLFDIPELHWVEAVHELHEDGTPHVHAIVIFRKR